MSTCYISKFRQSYHGGAHGGALLIERWSSPSLQKSHFFSYKLAHKCLKRPTIAPPCMRKFAHPFAPPFSRPTIRPPLIAPPVASKMWVFHENDANSSTSVAIRSLPPPHAPPHMTWLQSSWYQQNFFILSFSTKMCSLCCTDVIR